MFHQVKRSKNSNGQCSSDLSSSWQAILAKYSRPLGDGFSFHEPQEFVMGITAAEKVFGIDWVSDQLHWPYNFQIREEILHYAIYDNQPKLSLSRNVIKSVRLVQRSRLVTTSKLIRKCEDPLLIEVTLADDVQDKGKILEQFTERFDASTRLQYSFLPFKLFLGLEFFRHENFQILSACFTRLGDEMVELEIIYPFDGGNMSVSFPSLHFPILRKLSFKFSDNFYKPIGNKGPPNHQNNKFGFWLLQSILNASSAIKELVIPFTSSNEDVIPTKFKLLQLPPTIVSLQLELKLETETFETFFRRNQLPNLTDLTIQLHEFRLVSDSRYKVLEQYKETLVRFYVSGISGTGRRYPRSYLQFPQMEKLELVNIYSTECELGPADNIACLQESLPKLNCVCLWYQTEAMLKKWVAQSRFENVNGLSVSIINEHLSGEHPNYFRSPSWDTMTQLSEAFPNVRDLTVHVNLDSLRILACLFMKMRNVETLAIMFHGKFQRNSSEMVDSLLTGILLNLIGTLREHEGDVLEAGLVLRKNGRQSSLLNLSELTTLTLWTNNNTGGHEQSSLISGLSFGQAFLKMPKLLNLYLHGKFQPSGIMEEEWKRQGRFLTYSA